MTDHPRFEPIRNTPDQAHLSFNAGRLVDGVLRLVDWWLASIQTSRRVEVLHPADAAMRGKKPRASPPA